ncbi:hypothetical protein QR685DRAFT_525601 [Neurospora intermedia]|uniref:Uncharacterized protein n=1 Tax=Neurospora intermedia TaxID=5142 RepID=A0ABR3DER1_NEUIN
MTNISKRGGKSQRRVTSPGNFTCLETNGPRHLPMHYAFQRASHLVIIPHASYTGSYTIGSIANTLSLVARCYRINTVTMPKPNKSKDAIWIFDLYGPGSHHTYSTGIQDDGTWHDSTLAPTEFREQQP